MNPTHPTVPASMATHRLADANQSIPFAAYPGWQLDLRATLDSHAQLVEALEIIAGMKSGPCPIMHTLENAQDFARAALTAAQS